MAEPARPSGPRAEDIPAIVARTVEALMSRDYILHKVRTALGRSVDQPAPPPPPARIVVAHSGTEAKIATFCERLEALAGKTHRAASPADACDYVGGVVAGRQAVASNAPILSECGVTSLPWVRSGLTDREALRALCSTAAVGITSADFCLADTGTLVMLSSRDEARLISLLPPVHVAV